MDNTHLTRKTEEKIAGKVFLSKLAELWVCECHSFCRFMCLAMCTVVHTTGAAAAAASEKGKVEKYLSEKHPANSEIELSLNLIFAHGCRRTVGGA